jgi:myo-inositol-1(or 4)-monophosphatase
VPDAVDLSEALAVAREAARDAAEILLTSWPAIGRTAASRKTPRDLVTEADRRSEERILERIGRAFPDHAIVAEESGGRSRAGSLRWIVDPLDGTVNYANGIPFFCVSIGLIVDGRPQVGVIHDPTRAETFAATAGGPALLSGTLGHPSHAITASDKERLSDFVISMALAGRAAVTRSRKVRKAIRIPRSMGSAALALAYVGNGRFDAFIQQGGLSAWDVAAAGLIAERGGAVVTSMTGGPWFDLSHSPKSIGILAAPPAHHGTLLDLVR